MRRVARLGDGWHPIFRTVDQVREGLDFIRRECDRVGRDATTLRHVGRPIEPFSVEIVEAYQKLGIDDFMFVPPFSGPDLEDTRREMERMAAVAGLKPRR
jgi:alkanesulfonate monooxygenase SsuD/methylene tetrahydromethanopterin reductase-like flavin-dependent oxidoreductase (luciferase family)